MGLLAPGISDSRFRCGGSAHRSRVPAPRVRRWEEGLFSDTDWMRVPGTSWKPVGATCSHSPNSQGGAEIPEDFVGCLKAIPVSRRAVEIQAHAHGRLCLIERPGKPGRGKNVTEISVGSRHSGALKKVGYLLG